MIRGVDVGEMRLYSEIRPAIGAGKHRIELQQSITDADGDTLPVNDVTKHIEVVGPQISIPGPDIHSVFPPPNATGSFENRLPHIALKRRTLPWERESNGDDIADRPPWLVLVLLADGEGSFTRNVSIKEVYGTATRQKLGIAGSARCDMLEVTEDTIRKVFPREDELEFLVHVRQVNVNDTEFAGSDEDGFMSVVMGNRLPSVGRTYGAYLISLEGRFELLPDPDPNDFHDDAGPLSVYDNLTYVQMVAATYPVTGGSPPLGATPPPAAQPSSSAVRAVRSPSASAASNRSSGWHGGAAEPPGEDDEGAASFAPGRFLDAVDLLAMQALAGVEITPSRRFVVLAHWQFTCEGKGDFQQLMQCLDVGILGTQPKASSGSGCPPRVLPKVQPVVADSGHTKLKHLTRAGREVESWYRPPFTPREVKRSDRTHPYHAADQARTIGGDGIENLAYAAAFEVGRLLALSDPRLVRDLLLWRRLNFRLFRCGDDLKLAGLEDSVATLGVDLAPRLLARDTLVKVTRDDLRGVGPVIDPTEGLGIDLDDVGVISAGFGLSQPTVAAALGVSAALTVPGLTVADSGVSADFDELAAGGADEFEHLGAQLSARLEEIAEQAVARETVAEAWLGIRFEGGG